MSSVILPFVVARTSSRIFQLRGSLKAELQLLDRSSTPADWPTSAAECSTNPDTSPEPTSPPSVPEPTPSESVYRVRPWLDGAVIGVSALGVAIPYALSTQLIHPRCPCDPHEINALDRHVVGNHNKLTDTLSDVTVGGAWLAPVLLDALDVGVSRAFAEDMAVYAEALAVNGALVTVAKYLVQRPLPVVYAGQAPELLHQPGGYRSFYSGHTSNVVAALTAMSMTYTLRHGPRAWPWLLTAAVGLAVAAERVAAGRHFYTDVGVGALAGALTGYVVPQLHQRSAGILTVSPLPSGAQLSFVRPF